MNITKELEIYQFEKINEALFHNYPDAIFLLDSEGCFRKVNEQTCRISGFPREVLLGQSYDTLIADDLKDFTRERFEESKKDKPQRYETSIVTKKGVRHLDITNFPIKKDGKTLAIFGIAKDITDNKEREFELQRYTAMLKEHNAELEIFRKILAHDMRKPVANALGFAKLLQKNLPPAKDQEVRRYVLQSVEAIDLMLRDLNELISLQETGQETKEQVMVLETVEKVTALFQEEILQDQATVQLAIDASLQLYTVKAYFNSIVRNLLSNALKYRERSRSPHIRIEARQQNDRLLFTIQDNGIGMDMPAVHRNLFKMHVRFAPGVAEGNGFGLYIVYQQIQLMGGTIAADSYPGVGTTFTLTLPLT